MSSDHQLPPEAVGTAAGVFIYSVFCLSFSSLLLWAVIAHREWKSYVALLALFTSLSTAASIAQQLHTILYFKSIKSAQFAYITDTVGNPELSVAGASVGIDLVLFYIQFYCYNVQAILVLSWCTELAYSIYQLKASMNVTRHGSLVAKAVAILLPIIQVSLLRTKVVQDKPVAFYFLANLIMGVSLAIGMLLLLAILARYVHTRTLMSWNVQYANSSNRRGTNSTREDVFVSLSTNGGPIPRGNIYDRWLVVRFTIAFAGLSAFQMVVILSEVSFAARNSSDFLEELLDVSSEAAISDFKGFIAGVSASLLAFIVFGTTRTFRDFFYRKFVPRKIRRKLRPKTMIPSVVAPRRPATPAESTNGRFELDGGGVATYDIGLQELASPYNERPIIKGPKDDDKWPILTAERFI